MLIHASANLAYFTQISFSDSVWIAYLSISF